MPSDYAILGNVGVSARSGGTSRLPTYSEADRKLLTKIEQRANNELLFGLKYHVMRRSFLDLAYYNGFQHIYWSPTKHRIAQVPVNRGRSRITDNKIMPACQQALNLLSSDIAAAVRPKGSDFRARAEARLGDRAIRHQYRVKRWSRKIRKAMHWCVVTGVGFIRPYFNPHAGPMHRYYIDPTSGDPIPEEMLDENSKRLLDQENAYQEVREGDVDLAAHSAFDVYVPDTCEDTDDLQWYVTAYRRSLKWIQSAYPERGKSVGAEHFSAWERNSFEARVLSMAGGAAETGFEGFAGALAYDDDRSAILKIYVEPPTPVNPRGQYAVVANGVLLEKGDAPSYTFGLNGCDLIKFDFIARPGSFWPISLPENMISLQREHNAAKGQIADIRKACVKPKLTIPRGGAFARSSLTDQVAEVWEHEPGMDPKWAPTPDIPTGLFAIEERTKFDLADVSGQHEAMQGKNPSGVRAGYAINLLQEKDLNFYKPIIESHAEAFSQLWSHVHQMIKRTWSTPRFIEEISRSEMVWSGWVDGSAMAENARVVVDAENLMPKSKAASQAFHTDLLQFAPNLMQLPQILQSSILEGLEIGDTTKTQDIFELDTRWAEWAIETMIGDPTKGLQGYDVPVRPGIDDHQQSLQVVLMFMKTRSYDQLPPDAKARINRFRVGHANALMAQLQAEHEGGGGQEEGGQENENKEEGERQEAATA